MLKLDLHTHSSTSPDGAITMDQYARVIEDGTLDYVAVTDHDSIAHALELRKMLGDHIIVGEEITSSEGEIIGLFLRSAVPAHLTALETAQEIKRQGGLVYIPHPFETVRKGITAPTLDHIMELVDIIEVYNGRAVLQNKGPKAATTARLHSKPGAASSDAHGVKGLGTAYSAIKEAPTPKNLLSQLETAHLVMKRPPFKTLLYPKANRLKKRFVR